MPPRPEPRRRPAPPGDRDLGRAVAALSGLLGVDLGGYKPGVLRRRLGARVRETGAASPEAYLAALEAGGPEAAAEARHFLASLSVPVSGFFRDPAVYQTLETRVFPALLAGARDVRVWSAGCSRGQEAYSLAHTLARAAGRRCNPPQFAVLGTDLDRGALRQARAGVYSDKQLAGVSEARRREMFLAEGPLRWRVRPELAERVRFAAADLLDPAARPEAGPFDLVACRNLLIYLDRPVQEELILGLRETLRPGGYLVLGASETVIGRPWHLLEHAFPAQRIYRRPE